MNPLPVTPIPRLACVGKIDAVQEAATSASGNYEMLPISLVAEGAGQSIVARLLSKDIWLDPTFQPIELVPDESIPKGSNPENDRKRSESFVYGRNIARRRGDAHLQVLLGDAWEDFVASQTAALENGGVSVEQAREFLAPRLTGARIGYILRQRTSTLEDGSKVLDDGYNLESFFPVTAEAVARVRKQAAASEKAFAKAPDGKKDITRTLQLTF